MCLPVYLCVCVCLSSCVFVRVVACLFVGVCVCVFVRLSVCLLVCVFVRAEIATPRAAEATKGTKPSNGKHESAIFLKQTCPHNNMYSLSLSERAPRAVRLLLREIATPRAAEATKGTKPSNGKHESVHFL